MNISFRLIDRSSMGCIVPLLMELDPALSHKTIEDRLAMMLDNGYECVGIYDQKELVGICGIWTLVKYYIGKHLEPDNVFIKPNYQSKGIGQQLQVWLEALAASRGCKAIELNCYVTNEAGCRFWETVGYSQLGIHYQKNLANDA